MEYPTCQRLKVWATLLVRAGAVDTTALPITPVCNVLQALVELAVLQVFVAHKTKSTARIYEVIESDGPGGTILAAPGG